MNRKILIGSATAGISWILGYFGTKFLAEGMSAASNYALICGWWLSAYVCSVLAVPALACIPLFVGYLAMFLITGLSGQSWFYREQQALPFVALLGIGAAQALFVATPPLFNAGVRGVKDRFFASRL